MDPDAIDGRTDGASETGTFFHCPMELSYRTMSLFWMFNNFGTKAPLAAICFIGKWVS
jgi:hypothetical protein